MAKLTEKQRRFCEEYLIDLNGTQAAVRAGYKAKTARAIAAENLTKPDIVKYLQELMRQRSERTGIEADAVIRELRDVAMSDVEITGKEKLKALELLGKHLGLFGGSGAEPELTDDGFLDALNGKIPEVWDDE